MLIIKLHRLFKEIESRLGNVSTTRDGVDYSIQTKSILLTKAVLQELQILTGRIIAADDDPEIAGIHVDMKDYPLLQQCITIYGPRNVIKWLKEEVRKEMQHKRDTEAKEQDNKHTREMIDKVKDKKCRQTLEINPAHGSRVNLEKGDEA